MRRSFMVGKKSEPTIDQRASTFIFLNLNLQLSIVVVLHTLVSSLSPPRFYLNSALHGQDIRFGRR